MYWRALLNYPVCKRLFVGISTTLLTFHSTNAASASAVTFDLECNGKMTIKRSIHDKPTALAAHWHIRVDLNERLYCLDDCKAVERVARVEEGRIIFDDHKDYAGFENYAAVDRRTGAYTSRDYFPIRPGPLTL